MGGGTPVATATLAPHRDDAVGAVPVLDDLQAVVDLAAQLGACEVVADERAPYGSAELFEGLVGGVLGGRRS
jgi:hypothetical protein